ncbi:hypothetical protein B1750_gp314 [Noumeavirus]|uniref:hypothetical protein n=1 Tax=Noumeavirus TaxID=1955558 RepID=UPI000982DAFA|nr:hypothetical protein B1750_gp314 [Noumeavirus]AQM73295.1 hypothetical protein NMV_314 [Noumeavirus]
MGQTLEKPNEQQFEWENNVKVWKENYGRSDLKEKLSVSQFGEEREDCKLIWIRVPGKLFPLVVTPETSIRFLEKNVLPKLWNRRFGDDDGYIVKKVKLRKVTPFPEDDYSSQIWEESEDGSKYDMCAVSFGDSTCCYPCNKKYM